MNEGDRYPDDEDVAEALIENDLQRHTGIGASQDCS
jgi:hypothetical protein